VNRARLLLLGVIGASAVISAATLLIPIPPKVALGQESFHVTMMTTTAMACLHAGAAVLFWSGLDGFKARLRRAYFSICLGLLVYSVALLQYPIIAVFDLWNEPWALNGGLALPTIGALLIYTGLLAFAKALNVRYLATSPFVVLAAAIVLAFIANWAAGTWIDLNLTGNCVSLVIGIAVGMLVLRIKQTAGPAYTNALAWFALAPLVNAIGILLLIAFAVLHIPLPAIITLPFVFVGALYIKAGYSFNKIKEF
jgi:hypothetical protein